MVRNLYRSVFKRFFDVIFSVIGIIVLFPVMLILAVLIRIFIDSPVIFKQQRPGLHGKIFTIYKFRTMRDIYDAKGVLLPDEERLTSFGVFLRRTGLDELPQLWNVLNGDMSFIGPRALLVEYLDRYTPEQFRRHDVRPGFAGFAEICARNNLGWGEQFKLDIFYVENLTFCFDIKILFLIFLVIVFQKGKKEDKWVRQKFSLD